MLQKEERVLRLGIIAILAFLVVAVLIIMLMITPVTNAKEMPNFLTSEGGYVLAAGGGGPVVVEGTLIEGHDREPPKRSFRSPEPPEKPGRPEKPKGDDKHH